ncbi:Uma2 family endonuclease [Leptospira sp. 96542]|nr:Uma2 family endonuclease [Leptospira sp. 96542]
MSDTLTKVTPKYVGWKVTREEYLSLPDDGFTYDMIEGVLHLSPSAYFDHGNLQTYFATELSIYLRTHPLGRLTTETDIFLPDDGDVLRPDLSFILNENLSIIKGHIHGVPDLICEVLSESTKSRDLGVKADRYLRCGVREYWILDPKEKTSQVWYNVNSKSWQKQKHEKLVSKILPDFVLEKIV